MPNLLDLWSPLEPIVDLCVVIGEGGRVVGVSAAFLAASGLGRGDVIGRAVGQVLPTLRGVDNLGAIVARVVATGKAEALPDHPCSVPGAGGGMEARVLRPSVSALVSAEHADPLAVLRLEDVTLVVGASTRTRKLQEEADRQQRELSEAEERLHAANQELDRVQAAHGPLPLVLVVDDEAFTRAIMVDALAGEYRTAEAGDGSEGLAAIAALNPDLVILDLVMPVLDGRQAVSRNGAVSPNVDFPLDGTPFEFIAATELGMVPRDARARFPRDEMLAELGVDAVAAIPLLDAGGRPVGILGVMGTRPIQDVAAVARLLELFAVRTAAEVERQRSSRRFADLFDLAPDALLMLTESGVITLANRQAEQMFGYSRKEMLGASVERLMPGVVDGGLLREGFSARTARSIARRTSEGRRKSGPTFPVELMMSPMDSDDGRVVAAAVRDMTERQQALDDLERASDRLRVANGAIELERSLLSRRVMERTAALEASNKQLEQAMADAERANRAKSDFLAIMSHEIRTPMNGIVGMAEVLGEGQLAPSQVDPVRTIQESAHALLGIIDDILDFSKIEAGRVALEHIPVSVETVVESVWASLAPAAASALVDVVVFVDPAVPDPLVTDPTRLRQVLYNLLGNAVKFSAGSTDRRGRVVVRAGLAPAGESLVLEVQDNGIGIAPEVLPTLFSPFTQAEASTTRRFGGTGLGLVICKRIVALGGGDITVESEPGTGSTFTVRWPLESAGGPRPRDVDLAGLACTVVPGNWFDPAHLRAWLEHAGATVTIGRGRSNAGGDPVVVQETESWPAPFAGGAPRGRGVWICRGRRTNARLEMPGVVSVDADTLRRSTFLHAVAVAAARSAPERAQAHPIGRGPEPVPITIAEARATGRLILVVEDDAVNRKVILRQLGILGYAAEVAVNGRDGLALWRAGAFSLVLTDLHMPEMDGYTLTAHIREEEAGSGANRTPVVALTANALPGEAARVKALGADGYLTKPLSLRQLRETLDACALPDTGEAANTGGLVDLDVLRALVGDDRETIVELLQDFLRACAVAERQVADASAAGDTRQVGEVAHRLKSWARAVGASVLGELCADMELAAAGGAPQAVAARLDRFNATLGSVVAAVNEELRVGPRAAGE